MTMSFLSRITLCLLSYALVAVAPAVADDVVPVVSARSEVPTLTTTQLVDIFLGKQSRFPNGTPAMPIDQAEGNEVRDEFYKRFAGRSPAQLKVYWSKLIFTGKGQPPREASTVEKLRKAVAEHPRAIGYMWRSQVDSSLRVVELTDK
jgi:ABC-type phosphate transport system substrate-binding protein